MTSSRGVEGLSSSYFSSPKLMSMFGEGSSVSMSAGALAMDWLSASARASHIAAETT